MVTEVRKSVLNSMTEKKWSFNSLSGEVRTYDKSEDFDADMRKGSLVPLDRSPSKNCNSCYGRGYIGRDTIRNYYIPCGCMFDLKQKMMR